MIWTLTVLPIALLLLGLPIFLILVVTSMTAVILYMNVPLTQLHVIMFGSMDNYVLMSVPFFILAGELMGRGGISQRIVDWVLALVGSSRGSLGITTIGASTTFGAISGSSAATVASIGKLLHPALLEAGYGSRFSTGAITASGAIATVIPPSIPMILYAAVAEQSVSDLFQAGILPGLLMAGLGALYVYLLARARNIRDGKPFRWADLWRATRKGLLALGMPFVVLGGIYSGVFSPTEAAGIACVYAVAVTVFVYREIGPVGLWDAAVSSMLLTAQVLIVVAAAGVFSWVLTVSGTSHVVVGTMQGMNLDPWALLLVVNVLLLFVGCFLDPGSAILVLTPLLVPIVAAAGIDLVHFGIIITLNLSIGAFTPPFGLNIFVAQAVIGTPLRTIYAGILPFLAIDILALAVVTYVPELSLWLARG